MSLDITQFINETNIFFKFKSKTKESLLKEIVKRLNLGEKEKYRKEILKNLLKREKIASTAIEQHIAIPHCYCKNLDTIIIGIAVLPPSIKIKAKDKTIVKLIVMIIGDEQQRETYLNVLSTVATLLKNKEFFKNITTATSAKEIIEFFKSYQEIPQNLQGVLRHLFWIQKMDLYLKVFEQEKEFVSDEEKKIIDTIIESNEAAKQKIEQQVNPVILERFKNVQAKYDGVGIVKIENETCSGCNTILPATLINAVRQYNKVVQCENCGRILF